MTWFESGFLFALLLLPNYERLVIVSTVSGLGFQSENRNSVAVGAPNLVLLWFQGDSHIEGHRFPLLNLSLHKDWIHSRSSSRHLTKQSCLDPTFFRPVFLVRLTIWNCLPGAWLHASEWRSGIRNNEKFFSLDWYIQVYHLLRLPCTQKRKKLTDRSCLNDNCLINRAPSRLSYSSLKS